MSTSKEIERDWMRPQQAADYIGCSPSKLAKDRVRGSGIPFAKHGRLVLYSKSQIDEFFSGQLRGSTSEPGPDRQDGQ